MNLELTPFNKREIKKNWKLDIFPELGKKITFLSEENVDNSKCSFYCFGVKKNNDTWFWFFNKTAVLNERTKAIEVHNELVNYCTANNLGIPFIYKVKKYKGDSQKNTLIPS